MENLRLPYGFRWFRIQRFHDILFVPLLITSFLAGAPVASLIHDPEAVIKNPDLNRFKQRYAVPATQHNLFLRKALAVSSYGPLFFVALAVSILSTAAIVAIVVSLLQN